MIYNLNGNRLTKADVWDAFNQALCSGDSVDFTNVGDERVHYRLEAIRISPPVPTEEQLQKYYDSRT